MVPAVGEVCPLAGATEHRSSPGRPSLRGRAIRANEPHWPADTDQILATGLLAGKPFSELHQMLWKVVAQQSRSSPPTTRSLRVAWFTTRVKWITRIGDISWPEHVTIFTSPVRLAVQLDIKLIIWGENSQNEYGGPAAAAESNVLNRRWLEEFGGLLGFRVSDLIGQDGIEKRHLIQYTYPSDEELARVGVTGLFLGYYVPWDGYRNALVAQANGFETYPRAVEGSLVNYENLDNHQTGIHDYFKFLKFGFGRATDLACLHVRRGRLSRQQALQAVRLRDGRFPWTYLGRPIESVLREIDMDIEEFIQICDRFTNRKLFLRDAHGVVSKDGQGNLTKINYDNVSDETTGVKQSRQLAFA